MKIPLLVLALASCIALSMPASAEPRVDLLGDPAPVTAATRTIVITPDTRYVNVEGGETIRFVVGDQSFGWHFFVGYNISSFELNRVAPSGLLQRRIIAYVSRDPMYRGM
jgi:hypothetical protein